MFQVISGHISETVPRLLLITNRKWHTPCHVNWELLTLDDLEGRYAFFNGKLAISRKRSEIRLRLL